MTDGIEFEQQQDARRERDLLALIERDRAELLERGYIDIPEFRGMTVGARVRHYGEQYLEAHLHGTGVIAALMERTSTNGRPDIELVIRRDPQRGGTGRWANYHTVLVETSEQA